MIFVENVALTAGTAALTPGTAVETTLNDEAKQLLALIVSGCDPVYTTAEGAHGFIRMESDDLGIVKQDFEVGPYTTSGPATNGSGQCHKQEIVKLDYTLHGKETIGLAAGVSYGITTARKYNVGIMYQAGNEKPPEDWLKAFPGIVACKGGKMIAAKQITTTRTELTAIKTPAWANEIVGAKVTTLKDGAITENEYEMGYMEVQTTVKGTTPVEIPTNSLGATLGTPVGNGMYYESIDYIPWWMPLGKKQQTITPAIHLTNAVTTDNAVSFGILYR